MEPTFRPLSQPVSPPHKWQPEYSRLNRWRQLRNLLKEVQRQLWVRALRLKFQNYFYPLTKENKPAVDPPTTKFMCGVCNKYFGNQKNLRVHISEIHEGKRGQFPCDVCNKVFPRKRNMERHKNSLHLENNPVCYMCHKSVVNLEMHIKRFHKGSREIKIKLEESAATA